MRRQHALIAHRPLGRLEHGAGQMLDQHEGGQALEHRYLDRLAAPGADLVHDGGQQRDGDMQPRRLVGQDRGHIGGLRGQPLPARQVGCPGHGLDDVVIGRLVGIGAVAAIAPGRAMDDLRIRPFQRLVIQTELGHRLRAHGVHEHIRRCGQPHQHVAGGGLLQVQHDAALVAVGVQIHCAHAGMAGRGGGAHHVALWRFDLDHVRPHVAQHLRGIGAEHDRGEIENAEAGEGAGCGLVGHGVSVCFVLPLSKR